MEVRVRFAPSPTGPLHIGGVRTALFNYLFAKKNKGQFILRIEDTDQSRYVEGAEQYITDALHWSGIKIDEGFTVGGAYGPYKQSERKTIYQKFANKLIESDWAYYAFDSQQEIVTKRKNYESAGKTFTYDQTTRKELNNSLTISNKETQERIASNEPYVIRFKMPENETIKMHDLIRGTINVSSNTLDDKVLFKSDGLPTYHLANVVDDHLMKISHVIRGEEWLPSLPLHYMLYKALGWETEKPRFAHLPLLLKPTGKGKLSKRDGEKMGFPVFPLEWKANKDEIAAGYREDGYFPEAFINMLALLGWNPGTEQELFSMEELITHFELTKVQKSGARFDPDKARWFNQQYLQQKPLNEIAQKFATQVAQKGFNANIIKAQKVVGLIRERVEFLHQLWDQGYFFYEQPKEYDRKVVKKRWKNKVPSAIADIKHLLEDTTPWQAEHLKNIVSEYINNNDLGFGAIMNGLRLCIVGGAKGPNLFFIIEIIGKNDAIERIDNALNVLDTQHNT